MTQQSELNLQGIDFEEGYIAVIDKPLEWTSSDVVRKIKFALRRAGYPKIKVGHAGTLDPLATGILLVCIGKATISYRDAFIIGLAQAVATLPGLSRSGTTIATGLILGNRKESVAQFSFLMVLAPILGKMVLDLMSGELAAQSIGTAPLLAGFAAAFVVGCLACKFMINIVKRGKLNWFAIYCTLVGGLAIIRYFVIQ